MAPVVALTTHMQMQVLMLVITLVMVFMAVQLQPESRSHRQGTHHQESNAHEKFRPGGHRLHVDQILEPDRDQGQEHHSCRMPCPPGQTCPQRRQGFAQREGGHRHQMISAANDVNSTRCKTGQDADQQSTTFQKVILQERLG